MRSPTIPRRRNRAPQTLCSASVIAAVLSVASPASAATWAPVPSPNLTQFQNVLWGVDALSPGSAWAVGRADRSTVPINRPVIERWNGTRWSISASPLPPGGGELRDVDAVSSTTAWAVGFTGSSNGFNTLTERWNGASWSIVSSPSVSAQNYLAGVKSLSAGDVWAVGTHNVPGSLAFSTLTMHWDGSAWNVVPSPDTADFENHLTAIDGSSPDDLWAVGHTQTGSTRSSSRSSCTGTDQPGASPLAQRPSTGPSTGWSRWPATTSGRSARGSRSHCSGMCRSQCIGTVRAGALSTCPPPHRRAVDSSVWLRSRPPRCTRWARLPTSHHSSCAGTARAGQERARRPRERCGTPQPSGRARCGRSGNAAPPTQGSAGPSPCAPRTARHTWSSKPRRHGAAKLAGQDLRLGARPTRP